MSLQVICDKCNKPILRQSLVTVTFSREETKREEKLDLHPGCALGVLDSISHSPVQPL